MADYLYTKNLEDFWVNEAGETFAVSQHSGIKFVDDDGKPHREGDLPARFDPPQIRTHWGFVSCWSRHGKLHRDGDKPAWTKSTGEAVHFCDDRVHRVAGPAAYGGDTPDRWFLDHAELTQQEWAQDIRVVEFHSRTQEEAEEWLKRM